MSTSISTQKVYFQFMCMYIFNCLKFINIDILNKCIVILMHFIFVVGQNYIVAVTGFYCKLCSKFYNNEKAAKESHCQSRSHYDKYKVLMMMWCFK